jgi:hypothetical protein
MTITFMYSLNKQEKYNFAWITKGITKEKNDNMNNRCQALSLFRGLVHPTVAWHAAYLPAKWDRYIMKKKEAD